MHRDSPIPQFSDNLVKLSNKKIKSIHRQAQKKRPDQIASDLGITEKRVRAVLGLARSTDREKTTPVRFLSLSLLAVVFCIPFPFLPNIADYANLPKAAFTQIAAMALTSAWLLSGAIRGQLAIIRSPLNLPILCFVGWALISIAYGRNAYEGWTTGLRWVAAALAFFLTLNLLRAEKDRNRLLVAVASSGVLCAAVGIGQYLFEWTWVPQEAVPGATFANKNMAAQFIVMAVPVGVSLFLSSRKTGSIWFFAMATALMVLFLAYTKTRSSWVALAAQGAFGAILLIRHRMHGNGSSQERKKRWIAGAGALVVVLVMINVGPDGFRWGLGEISDRAATMVQINADPEGQYGADASIGLRLAIWQNTLAMIRDHVWTGLGLGNHKVVYPLYYRKIVEERIFSETSQLRHVHNDYLQIFSELGIVGILILGWLAAVGLQQGWRMVSATPGTDWNHQAFGISGAMLGISVVACFSFPFQLPVPPFLLMTLLALAAAVNEKETAVAAITIGIRPLLILVTVITVAALALLVRHHYLGIRSDHHFGIARWMDQSDQFDGVIRESRMAYALNPGRKKLLSLMGRALVETGRYREGINALKQVLSDYPNHMTTLLNLGAAYRRTGDHDRALEAYRQALAIMPDYAMAHNNIGTVWMDRGQMEKARDAFQRATIHDPENAMAVFNLGLAALRLKRYQEAADAFEATIALNPNQPLAHKNLGIILVSFHHQADRGIDHFKTALTLDPDIPDAAQMRKIVGAR
jgi:O-antigen ligase/thioredoxin-like negative regulator of GroEL